MKGLLKCIFAWFDQIGKDKYEHFALGAILASIIFVIAAPMFFWFALSVSIFVTMGVEIAKEYYYDVKPDWKDILATFLGGATIWISLIVAL